MEVDCKHNPHPPPTQVRYRPATKQSPGTTKSVHDCSCNRGKQVPSALACLSHKTANNCNQKSW